RKMASFKGKDRRNGSPEVNELRLRIAGCKASGKPGGFAFFATCFLHVASPGVNVFETANSGARVYQAMAGKNIIGTARPGNNSGVFIVSGSVADIGAITQANERMENSKVNAT